MVRLALSRERVVFDGETLQLPLPDGPGRALKLTIGAVQDQIPIYLAAIGPRNTTLAGEIADGWLPTFFSPENVGEFRELLQAGADRAGRTLDDFDIAPTVQVFISDDHAAARDLMRPILALYIGGMGSRKQNFYKSLVERYGFGDAAAKVQDLYLDGKRVEAGAALPDELIDMISLCGPRDVVRERLGAFRDAGVGTLIVSPMAFDLAGPPRAAARRRRAERLSEPARVARAGGAARGVAAALLSGRVRRRRPRVPDARARRRARPARPRGHVRDLDAMARARRGRRDAVRRRAGVPGVPDP